MSKQYDDTNRGTLGRNKRREKDTHPEFSGRCSIEGVEYWISGWVRESNGEKFFSLSFRPKEERAAPKPAAPARLEDDDSIPF